MTDRRTRRAKRPLAYVLTATLAFALLAASVLGLSLRGWTP